MGPHVDKILVLHEGRIEEGMFIHILICKVILITVSYLIPVCQFLNEKELSHHDSFKQKLLETRL